MKASTLFHQKKPGAKLKLRANIRKERILHIRSEALSVHTRIRNSNYREKGRGNRCFSCVFRPRATIFLEK
ncbi:hypothetical protein BpHYR1_045819 [Brachionus plicatilis]|uniref:Uncharacterized protein n=1 Tax=Brachionus plicatilis TaxID=10195 RepID=A0A3M7QCK1_BRAPC|nr:hypothetical protein BpHYR1_045819 [Brachionus plicatilis]